MYICILWFWDLKLALLYSPLYKQGFISFGWYTFKDNVQLSLKKNLQNNSGAQQ